MSRTEGPHNHSEIDELKARVSLADVVGQSGVVLRKVGKNLVGRCPFHEDREASLVVNPERQLFNCFGCQSGGDALSFLQFKESLSFAEALERLRILAGSPPSDDRNGVQPARQDSHPTVGATADILPGGFTRAELLERVATLYSESLRESRPAQQYLVARGLGSKEVWEAFRIGAATGSLLKTLPQKGEIREALMALGVVTPRGKEHFAGCVVVPLTHPDRGVVGLYGRKIASSAPIKHLYLPGPQCGVLNWQALKLSPQIVVAESVIDAMSVWVAGCREVTCLFGVQGLPQDLSELLGRFATREVLLCLDADDAGRDATARLSIALSGRGIHCFRAELPDGHDANQILVEQGAPALLDALRNHKSTAPVPPASPAPQEASSASQEAECHQTEHGFVLRFGSPPLEYRVTPQPPYVGRMRVTLRVSFNGTCFTDRLDVFAHRSRAAAINQIGTRMKVPKHDVERHFLALIEETERWVEARTAESQEIDETDRPTKPPEMTEKEREEALEFLRRPDLVEAILQDMEALGYTGEEQGKLLAYLIGVSRKLERPLSGIILSQSGAGKSSMAELVETLAPPENVVLYSRISAQALGYLPRDFLKRKLLIMEERVGAEQADYSIRQLQSRARISQAIVVKDPTSGKMQTRHFEVEGPIAYLETTTNSRINQENATRCFELHLDESEEQTRRIHQRQREGRQQASRVRPHSEAIRTRHHNAQRLLEPVRIFIPYVSVLSFPTRWLRTRRDHERFLCLIEAVAFLHQYQREGGTTEENDNKGVRFIRATLADYALAYNLAREVLRTTLHELTREGRELWEAAVAYVSSREETDGPCFTRRDLRGFTGWQDYRLRDALAELVEMEYIGVVAGSQGRTYHYRLVADAADVEPLPLAELTTPQELERLLEGGGQPR